MRTVYGLVDSKVPKAIRYVGSTKLSIDERFGQHLSLARYAKEHDKFQAWLITVEMPLVINLTAIKPLTEGEWVKVLIEDGAELFNVQFSGGQSATLKRAWEDPKKRARMMLRPNDKARLAKAVIGLKASRVRDRLKITSIGKTTSQETRNKIKTGMAGKLGHPWTEEMRQQGAITTKLWHRRKQLGAESADVVWLKLLNDVRQHGLEVFPRGQKTLEMLGSLIVVDMTRPVVTIRERKLGYKFLCAEAAWILSGDNRVKTIEPFSKTIANFSDNGRIFFGAYGPKLRAQLDYVAETLRGDRDTRQAVANIWRDNPPATKDVPCTLSCQFMIRNGRLDAFVTMRSSDVWLGICYDIFNFSMWAAYVLLASDLKDVRLGHLYNVAASRHLYGRDFAGADLALQGMTLGPDYAAFDPAEFDHPDHLTAYLWACARGHRPKEIHFLEELF